MAPGRRGDPDGAVRPPLRAAQRPALPAAERTGRSRQCRGQGGRGACRCVRGRRRSDARRARPLGATAHRRRGSSVSPAQRLNAERWLAWVRLGVVPFAVLEAIVAAPYPPGRAAWLWTTTVVFAAGAVAFLVVARRELSVAALARVGLAALVFDFAVVSSFILAVYYEPTTQIRQVMILVLVEAAFRYGIRGGLILAALSIPV